jgi:hypothetical protein
MAKSVVLTGKNDDKGEAVAWREGDWICECGMHNFRNRVHCARCGQTDNGKGMRGVGLQARKGKIGSASQEPLVKIKKPKHLKRKLEQAKAEKDSEGAEAGVAIAVINKLEEVSKDLSLLKTAKAAAWKSLCQKLARKQGIEWNEEKYETVLKSGCNKANFMKALGIDQEKDKDKKAAERANNEVDDNETATSSTQKDDKGKEKGRPSQGSRKRKRDSVQAAKEAREAAAAAGIKKENPAKKARREARAVKQAAYNPSQN